MLQWLCEAAGTVFLICQMYVGYCLGAAYWYGEPFPDHAVVLTRILVGVAAVMLFCSVVYGVRAAAAYRRDRRRLGMIRMDTSGRFYYDKRK